MRMSEAEPPVWRTDWGGLVAYVACVLGVVAMVLLIVGLVDAAQTRERLGMLNIALSLRILAVGDAAVVLAGAAVAQVLLKTSIRRVAVMAVLTWAVLVPSVLYTAQLTLVPY